MIKPAYYNEINRYAAQWLRNLIAAGHIAPGDVDTRSIEDVHPHDLRPYAQCHFFAGIGGWSLALRFIGWPDDRRIWSMSCPCQPFSEAGKGGGFTDERHLWPAAFHLISNERPERIVGEQVAGKDGVAWFDLVCSDLEAANYTPGAVPFASAGTGAPNIRERTYWVADANDAERWSDRPGWYFGDRPHAGREETPGHVEGRRGVHRVADAPCVGQWSGPCDCEPAGERGSFPPHGGGVVRVADTDHDGGGLHLFKRRPLAPGPEVAGRGEASRLGYAAEAGHQGEPHGGIDLHGSRRPASERTGGQSLRLAACDRDARPGPVNGVWRNADWLLCNDPGGARWRPVEPWTFPLAHGLSNRMGRLCAYGNAINPHAAAHFLSVIDQPVNCS